MSDRDPPSDPGSRPPARGRGVVSLLVVLAVCGLVWLLLGGPRVPW